MARKVSISDIIQTSGVHKDWTPTLRRCAEHEWKAIAFGAGKGFRVTSPDGGITFRIPNGRAGDAKRIEGQVTRWMAEQHLKAANINADIGEVSEIPALSSGGDDGSVSQIRCDTHDKVFTSIDAWVAHVKAQHAKMDEKTTEGERAAPEPEETPSEAPAEEESSEPEKPTKNWRGKEYQRGPYRKHQKMEGWLAREIWTAMRKRTQRKEEGLSVYAQALADSIDPNRHDAPGWGVETRPKEVVREVTKEVASPEAQEALEAISRIREMLGVDPEAKRFLEERIEQEAAKALEAEAEAKRLRDNLAAIVGLAADELKGES